MEQYDGADPTEIPRRLMTNDINNAVESNDKDEERKRLEKEYGQIWDTMELGRDFVVEGFLAPFIMATNKETGEKGTLQFQHAPRFYFNWKANY